MNSRALSVLHVDSARTWGGGQNQVRLLMRGLVQRGVRQLCVCPRGSPLAQRLIEERLPVHEVAWSFASDPRALFAIARVIGGYDIVHCHDSHALQLALIPARLRGTRIIASRRVHFATRALTWNRADRIIAVHGAIREAMIRSGIDADKIRVVHSGIDIDETRQVPPLVPPLRARLGLSPDAFVVFNAANLLLVKGQTVIPEAAARLPNVHWLIAGEGPERGAITDRINALVVADRVHLLGWLEDARPAMREAQVVISTSLQEGWTNSVLEAMALGVPVVASDVGGPAEILRPVHEALGASLFEPADATALSQKIERLHTEPELRREMVDRQRERLHELGVDETAARTEAVYRELLS